jgi:hypothetical protein
VYLDLEDGYNSCGFLPAYRQFDAVFRAKYNERCFHPKNHVPWVLGLTSRMIACTNGAPPWAERQRDILINFNASHPYIHQARALMDRRFTPVAAKHFQVNRERDDLKQPPEDAWDLLMWKQTQQRHSHSYYKRLCRSQVVAAFCGELIPPAPLTPPYLVGGKRARLLRAWFDCLGHFDPRPPRLIQWDSWRFWESLAAGCLVINFDLPHFGVKLPVMPVNFVHYVGIRLDNTHEVLTRLAAEPDLPERIAAQGRVWVMEHYTPAAVARRFLDRMLPR